MKRSWGVVRGFWLVACVAGLLIFAGSAWGQISTAALNGVVTDRSGAVVPTADVTVTQLETNLTFHVQTDTAGRYTYLTLPVGHFRITVEHDGFKTVEREFELTVSQAANLNLTLDVGQRVEIVNVTSEAPLVNASNSTVGTVVGQRSIFDLPLNGRNFANLITLTPGVSPVDVSQGGAGPSIQGQRNRDNSYEADGVSLARPSFGNIVMTPPLDSIEEFRVQSVNGDAEFGQASGGFVNVVTKAGTDKFHGTAYDYLRNNSLDARNTFQTTIPKYRQNQFGFSVGGPVYIPKVFPFDKLKHKTWFFLSYEGLRYRQAASSLAVVRTAAEQSGNFSGLPLIYNPFTTVADPTSASGYSRQPFPSNQIPASLMNKASVAYAQGFLPAPNISLPGSPNNFINTSPSFANSGTWMGRIDQSINQNNRVTVRWLQADSTNGSTLPVGTNLVSGSFASPKNMSAELNSTISPTTLLTLRYGYSLSNLSNQSAQTPDFYNTSGFNNPDGFPINHPGQYILPSIGISGYSTFLSQTYSPEEVSTHSGTVDLQKILGRHTLKAGFSLNHWGSFLDAINPSESFNVAQTQNLASPNGTGDGFASFLLGVPSAAGRAIGDPALDLAESYYGIYLQDAIRISRRLSVDLGLRWDYNGQATTAQTLGSFDERGGGWLLTGPTGIPNSAYNGPNVRPGIIDPDWRDFSPRIGVAYSLTSRWVLRSGYGIFYDLSAGRWQMIQGPRVSWPRAPFEQTSPLNQNIPTVGILNPFVGYPSSATLPNPFRNADGSITYPSGYHINAEYKAPYVHEWNFAVERQVSDTLVASATYVGSAGKRLECCGLINQAYQNTSGAYNTAARPYPQMGVFRTNRNDGYSNYSSLEVKVEKRFSKGLSFLSSFTYAKSTDLGCSGYIGAEGCQITQPYYPTPYAYGMDHAVSAFDLTCVFTTSLIYELPVGKGKLFDTHNRFLDIAVGGWQVSGILTDDSGLPLTIVLANSAQTNIGTGVSARPNLIGSVTAANQSRYTWFNTGAFAIPNGYSFGTAGRNILRGPMTHAENISLFKNFPLRGEAIRLQYRADMFNAFNSTVYGNPGTTLGTSSFGVISSAASGRIIQMAMKVIF